MNKQTLLGERLRRKADDPRDATIRELRALCAREALRIESLSHVVQDDNLRTAMHSATMELRAAGEGKP